VTPLVVDCGQVLFIVFLKDYDILNILP